MRILLMVIYCCVMYSPSFAQADSLPGPEGLFAALIVENIDRSADWYSECFGLELWNEHAVESLGLRQANLSRGPCSVELIELASALDPETAIPGSSGKTRLRGIFKVGFFVNDFDGWLEHLESVGAEFHGRVVTDPATDKRMVIILDPDRNRIQLFEK